MAGVLLFLTLGGIGLGVFLNPGEGENENVSTEPSPNKLESEVNESGGGEAAVSLQDADVISVEDAVPAAVVSNHNLLEESDVVPTDEPRKDVVEAVEVAPIDVVVEPVAVKTPLKILSEPRGARVYLDGTYKGKTPYTLELADDKSHKITMRKKGYKARSKSISASSTSPLNIKLKKEEEVFHFVN
jgi:hypothetical protein